MKPRSNRTPGPNAIGTSTTGPQLLFRHTFIRRLVEAASERDFLALQRLRQGMAYWLYKTEPEDYGWDRMVADGATVWDGLRNNQALQNIRLAAPGDLVMFYETGKTKAIVGLMEVTSSHYSDPKKDDPKFAVVDVKVHSALNEPVTLAAVKTDGRFSEWLLVRNSRLGAMPVPDDIWGWVLEMASGTSPV